MQGIANVVSVEPPMAPQKQRRTVMMITKQQFSWKHNAVKYLYNTLTNPHVKCQMLLITT
jgi:hypothetical protein